MTTSDQHNELLLQRLVLLEMIRQLAKILNLRLPNKKIAQKILDRTTELVEERQELLDEVEHYYKLHDDAKAWLRGISLEFPETKHLVNQALTELQQ